MTDFIDQLRFLTPARQTFSRGWGSTDTQPRGWEDAYRSRWQHDRVVRSTHGVNCTGSCSWKIYVKNGIVTWETQQTDYPRNRPGLPDHEPRGCPRGASYSWYMYGPNRIKHPLARASLVRAWRQHRKALPPVAAWQAMMADRELVRSYQRERGLGGLVRISWEEANDIIAAANIHTARTHGPDRIVGFSPIPAMSMVSYAAGTRYLSLIGGAALSFYDWYCDLPPASPQVWGEQTDVSESADWYASGYLILWGSNVPQTRTPDAHFMAEARYRGTKVVAVTPDYAEVTKFGDEWLHPRQGTDAALALAMGHVILNEFHIQRQDPYFTDYCRRFTDMPQLVLLEAKDGAWVPGRFLRAADLPGAGGEGNNPQWKTLVVDEATGDLAIPQGSAGFRWGQEENGQPGPDQGKWSLRPETSGGQELHPLLSLENTRDDLLEVLFPCFESGEGGADENQGGGRQGPSPQQKGSGQGIRRILRRFVPVKRVQTTTGEAYVATVFDLNAAQYGIDRGYGDGAASYDDATTPNTPAWQEAITGVPRAQVIRIAREFAANAAATKGRSMVIMGAGLNHWYHMDMSYRAIIAMLLLCGCVGQPGGGWAHYVGQEKLRPQAGWQPLAFATDWNRPARQMNATSFFYAHTDQWRYETVSPSDLLSPLADRSRFTGSMIDFNVRAERMGWLPSVPQLNANPLHVAAQARQTGMEVSDYVVSRLQSGELRFASEDPDSPESFPRNMFVWRSNLLGASGKGHEYFLKHLLGTRNGLMRGDIGTTGAPKPEEVVWRPQAPEGKLDLLVTLDFRMSSTCLYSDIVLPTATFYEKNDLNTTDMHPFIHPFTVAVEPAWEARSDWDIFKGLAKRFSELCPGWLGQEEDVVGTPILHDTAGELAQPDGPLDWRKGECAPLPGRTMPNFTVVARDYPRTYERFTSLGPLLAERGNGTKGISWPTWPEIERLKAFNGTTDSATGSARARIETDLDAAEVILSLAPETNGAVAVRAWQALSRKTGGDLARLAQGRADERMTHGDLQTQPRRVITSPTWSGIESARTTYCASYTNVHEGVPWRTLTGRQQFYQDHEWMRAFGVGFCTWRPPLNLGSHGQGRPVAPNGHPELVLNFITPHQKWGIHSSYGDNLLMLTLSRGGPTVWLSEKDATRLGVADNDWIEAFNSNGALAARAVVSQRVPEGMSMMYHAQEKTLNVPGAEANKRRGLHNSVTRVVPNPVHMIGGYAQLSYGFNYYGTVGSNRDEFVTVRKMAQVDWLEGPQERQETKA
ncbi:nitrate reductase subunit alpha [Formicincola oecophyllae]|uniref:nitrate reductase (quinone) n=1 Tax=Formicincola oecophyllae TaxID=2558361 RepID=A0A4Y6UA65_9PROT|nr:nitrate reductase subunit alpha [Formicincola oecophyllae]QDH13045.1 nitrate reductase subunit alpha [Formicincola oecophyllae]